MKQEMGKEEEEKEGGKNDIDDGATEAGNGNEGDAASVQSGKCWSNNCSRICCLSL